MRMRHFSVDLKALLVLSLTLAVAVTVTACGSSSSAPAASSRTAASISSTGSPQTPASGTRSSASTPAATAGKLTPPHVVIDCLSDKGFERLTNSTTVQQSVPDTGVVNELSGPSTVRTQWADVYKVAIGPDAEDTWFFTVPASMGSGEVDVVVDGTEKMAESRVEEAKKNEALLTHGAPNPGVVIGERDNVTWAILSGPPSVESAIAGCVPYEHSGAPKPSASGLPSESSPSSSSRAGPKLEVADPCHYFPQTIADAVVGRGGMVSQGNETMSPKPDLLVQCEYESPHGSTEAYAFVSLLLSDGAVFKQGEEVLQHGLREAAEKGEAVTGRIEPAKSLGVPAYFNIDNETSGPAATGLSFLSGGLSVTIETGNIPPSSRLNARLEEAAKRVIAGE